MGAKCNHEVYMICDLVIKSPAICETFLYAAGSGSGGSGVGGGGGRGADGIGNGDG